jgi:hypothetical protein
MADVLILEDLKREVEAGEPKRENVTGLADEIKTVMDWYREEKKEEAPGSFLVQYMAVILDRRDHRERVEEYKKNKRRFEQLNTLKEKRNSDREMGIKAN